MAERTPNFLCIGDHLMDILPASIISNDNRLETRQEFGKILVLVDNFAQLCREDYKAIVKMSWRFVGPLLGVVPLVEGHRAVGLTV